MSRKFKWVTLIAGGWVAAAMAADPTPLGKQLTPLGGEMAASKDGRIPAYEPANAELPGYSFGKLRGDFFKFKSEQPLFVISAANVDQYASNLAPAQVQMLKTLKGYTMPVYPTHRSCQVPDFVQANTRKNASQAKIAANGWAMEGASLPGVPFPTPTKGIEAVWNHLTRYMGVAEEFQSVRTYISPSPGSDRAVDIVYNLWQMQPNSVPGDHTPAAGALFQGLYYGFVQPSSLSGQGVIQRFYFDKPTESYYYFTGQRRVRRLPTYDYDAPEIGYENMYNVDQTTIFYGAPDRFDWKIVGKKEMYVPYNEFGLYDFKKGMKDVLQTPNIFKAEVRRYELHRVWVIEGTVKQGIRHVNPKRTLYLDEDSWVATGGEDYDAQGQVWKWKESSPIPAWELGGACVIPETFMFDFTNNRMVADSIPFGANKDIRFYMSDKGELPQLKDGYYTSESLQRMSDR